MKENIITILKIMFAILVPFRLPIDRKLEHQKEKRFEKMKQKKELIETAYAMGYKIKNYQTGTEPKRNCRNCGAPFQFSICPYCTTKQN